MGSGTVARSSGKAEGGAVSSVYGVIRLDGRPISCEESAGLERLLRPRSPDGFKQLQADGVVFGHGLLRTRMLREDMHHLLETERYLLSADLRLENQSVLKRQLHLGAAADDALVLLEAYLRWGNRCGEYLRGDFAFAIWDKAARHLFCCRDHLAARPLYYSVSRDIFAFASEPEALTQLDSIASAPNEERIANLLVPGLQIRELDRTWQRDVLAIMGGEYLEWTPERAPCRRRYWSLVQPEILHLPRLTDYVEAFHEKFSRALSARVVTSNCALLLSGGMDSASIVAAIERQGLSDITSYSLTADGEDDAIESECIHLLQQVPAISHNVRSFEIEQLGAHAERLSELAWQKPNPIDNTVLPLRFLASMTGSDQRVLLHGAAGDVTQASSLELPTWLIKRGQFIPAWHECRAMNRNHTYYYGKSALQRYLLSLGAAVMPTHWWRRLRDSLGSGGKLRGIGDMQRVNPEFAARLNLLDKLQSQVEAHSNTRESLESLDMDQIMLQLQSTNTASDRIAGSAGMVGRDPWADRELVEFYCGLPLNVRMGNGWTKYLARCALADSLPAKVIWRRDKSHLGWRLNSALLTYNTATVRHEIDRALVSLRPYVSEDELTWLSSSNLVNPETQDRVLQLLTLGAWLDQAR